MALNVELLEEFIAKNKLTKKEFAQRCGLSTFVVRRILKGEGKVKGDAILKLSYVTKIGVDKLLRF